MANEDLLKNLKQYGRSPQVILKEVATTEDWYAHLTEVDGYEGTPPRRHKHLTWLSDEEYVKVRVRSYLRQARSLIDELDRAWLRADPDDADSLAARERLVAFVEKVAAAHPAQARHRDAQALPGAGGGAQNDPTPEPSNA